MSPFWMRSAPVSLSRLRTVAAVFGFLAVATATAGAQESDKTKSDPAASPVAEIRDPASLFSRQAVASARTQLERVSRETGVSIAIETIETLNDEPAIGVARRLARRWDTEGVFILIAKKERVLEELVSKSATAHLSEGGKTAIRAAFLDEFRRKNFDRGLSRGVSALADNLMRAPSSASTAKLHLPGPSDSTSVAVKHFSEAAPVESGQSSPPSLVERNRIRLTLRGAKVLIAAAETKARVLTKADKFVIAIVDDGGHLLAFERMDDGRPVSVYTAITSAAMFRQPTGPAARSASPLPSGSAASPGAGAPADQLLSLSLQSASGGRITSLEGGVPIVVDGQVIGAIGIGGGVGEQDAEIARAAVQVFLEQLEPSRGAAAGAVDPAKASGPVKP
jgi:glc operon protein GlcG